MAEAVGLAWSGDVGQAGWIGGRLAPSDSHVVTSVIPDGFEAYARVLHPAEDWFTAEPVRWAQVAAWSQMPLDRGAQFHSVALPPERPHGEAPSLGRGPREGSLYPPDAETLATLVRAWTATPRQCWFCLWDGYGWDNIRPMTGLGERPAPPPPDPIPAEIRDGPRVCLPGRDYFLYRGPAEEVLAPARLAGDGQTANLWWPQDLAWCVATEIDLHWTYVGGPAGLIDSVAAETRLEVLPAAPHDPLTRTEEWVTRWARQATAGLLAAGQATITTSRGTVRAWLTPPSWHRKGALRTRSADDNGQTREGWSSLGRGDKSKLRRDVQDYLTWAIIELADD